MGVVATVQREKEANLGFELPKVHAQEILESLKGNSQLFMLWPCADFMTTLGSDKTPLPPQATPHLLNSQLL